MNFPVIRDERIADLGNLKIGDASVCKELSKAFSIPGTERRVAIREIENGAPRGNKELKVAYAQVRSEPGGLDVNTIAHKATMQAAYERGCDMVQFPEMSLTHYCSLDLLIDKAYLKAQEAWLQELVEFSKETPGLTSVVGFVDVDWDKTRPGDRPWGYNSLAVIRDGEIIETIHKKLLPNYDVFDEVRWYEAGTETKVVDIKGVKVGFLICEDVWTEGYQRNPVKELIDAGAEFLSHSAASPIHIGKNETRAAIAAAITDTYEVPFGSVNMIGCFDGYEGDLPFDGRGLVRSGDGKWLAMGAPFKEELLIIDPFNAVEGAIEDLRPIQEIFLSTINSIQSYFYALDKVTNTKNAAVIGNSGGIDSAVVIGLAVAALGAERVQSISIPTKYNTDGTMDDAEILAKSLGVEHRSVPMQGFYEAGLECMAEAVNNDPTSDHRIEQNLQARLRTAIIMGFAQMLGGVMLNTSNKTERVTNNFTIYADSSGAFSSLGDVDKDRVEELAWYINDVLAKVGEKGKIPESIIVRPPSAQLGFNQVDSTVMGGEPRVIAPHVRTLIEAGPNDYLSARELLPAEVSDAQVRRWMGSLGASEWKGRQLPPATRVTKKSFGFNRRIPINHLWRGQVPK
jgi:NAD+ synthase (glutamine-hydrolysing)